MMHNCVTKMSLAATLLFGTAAVHATTYSIAAGDVTAFKNALSSVAAGDTINLAAGTYSLSSNLSTSHSGSSGNYITINGAGSTTILQLTADSGCVFHIGHSYYKLQNMYLDANSHGTKGLLIEAASHGYVTNVTVDHTLNEGFKIRKNSQYWLISNCTSKHTGMSGQMYGEGYYVSDADQNWTVTPDNTGYITFSRCVAYKTANDGFDLKEGSHHIKLVGCKVDFANITTSNTRGANAVYNRANYSQVINSVYVNNLNCQDGGWFVLANQTTASNGVTYGNHVQIKNCSQSNTYCEGAGKNDILIDNGFSDAKVYSDTTLTYTGTKPQYLDASTFTEMTWSGEGGGVYGTTVFAP